MTITRIDAEARWSDVVIHNQTLYYRRPGQSGCRRFRADRQHPGADRRGTGKTGQRPIPHSDATIFLANKDDFAAMNKAWDAWGGGGSRACTRCTVEATLMKPEIRLRSRLSRQCKPVFFIFILKARHDPLAGMGGAKFFRHLGNRPVRCSSPGTSALLNTFNRFSAVGHGSEKVNLQTSLTPAKLFALIISPPPR